MIVIGIIHISLLLSAYLGYLFITLKSFSGEVNYRFLLGLNIVYATGFILGMIWSKIEWGMYLSPDIKIILSIAVFLPFVAENILRTKRWYLPALGSILILMNYVIPAVMNSIHTH
jgi:ABC-type transport system involved in cytochrome c biogenesis permease subunit